MKTFIRNVSDALAHPVPSNLSYKVRQGHFERASFFMRTFLQLDFDEGTYQFVECCKNRTWRDAVKDSAASVFKKFMSVTSANGLSHRGSMFVFSKAQLKKLLDFEGEERLGMMLDVGAGDGNVTIQAAEFFEVVCATEVSVPMLMRLSSRGFCTVRCEQLKSESFGEGMYDAVFLLNLLDRVSRPTDIIHNAKRLLSPDGLLVIAVVLPWCPFVERGTKKLPPDERLSMDGGWCCEGASFEQSLEKFVVNVLEPIGLDLVRWSKLPYLCAGDHIKPYYVLHDAVLVLKQRAPSRQPPAGTPDFLKKHLSSRDSSWFHNPFGYVDMK